MKVLILGSEGFIGGHLVSLFLFNKADVYGADLMAAGTQPYQYFKISRLSPELEELMQQTEFDVCINAAGSGNVQYSVKHPINDFEANSLDTIRVLDSIKRHQPKCRYVHISSAAVYGNPAVLPIKETQDLKPLSPYGFHKFISETICREYSQLFGIPVAIVRPFSVYGSGLKKQLLWDICQKLHSDKSVVLWGTGSETRDFIHVSDLVTLIFNIVERSPFECDVYNAATGLETSIREVGNIFELYYPGHKSISFSGDVRIGDPINWRAEIERIDKLGFTPEIELEQGVIEYIHWFLKEVEK